MDDAHRIGLLLLIFLLAGCATPSLDSELTHKNLNRPLQSTIYDSGSFPLFAAFPITPIGTTLRVYIEGDGRAWIRSGRPSSDPTPKTDWCTD